MLLLLIILSYLFIPLDTQIPSDESSTTNSIKCWEALDKSIQNRILEFSNDKEAKPSSLDLIIQSKLKYHLLWQDKTIPLNTRNMYLIVFLFLNEAYEFLSNGYGTLNKLHDLNNFYTRLWFATNKHSLYLDSNSMIQLKHKCNTIIKDPIERYTKWKNMDDSYKFIIENLVNFYTIPILDNEGKEIIQSHLESDVDWYGNFNRFPLKMQKRAISIEFRKIIVHSANENKLDLSIQYSQQSFLLYETVLYLNCRDITFDDYKEYFTRRFNRILPFLVKNNIHINKNNENNSNKRQKIDSTQLRLNN